MINFYSLKLAKYKLLMNIGCLMNDIWMKNNMNEYFL